MNFSDVQIAAAVRLAIAALIGLGVGLEREWSGHASGPSARFAGIRTFLLLGLIGGSAGLLAEQGYESVAAAIVAGSVIFAVSAYVMVLRQPGTDRDGTTEVAAIVVVTLGLIATAVSWLMAAAAGSLVVLALNEKKRLHGAVRRVHQDELNAALRFSVLALAVLPFLPEGPYLAPLNIRPRSLWMIVLLFCAINFTVYLARKNAKEERAYLLAGLLGGVISSTAITLGFARFSRQYPRLSAGLAAGVIGACTILVPRVIVISAAINPDVAISMLPYVVPAGLLGGIIVALAWKYGERWEVQDEPEPGTTAVSGMAWLTDEKSPLRFWVAIRLAIVFQLAIVTIAWIRDLWSVRGLYGTAVVLGLTNSDALTVSMSAPSLGIDPSIAGRAIAVGILSNTAVKLAISAVLGSGRYRLIAGGVLLLMAGMIAAALVFL